MFSKIVAPIVSVSELKKDPAKVTEKSRIANDGVYVFNNNKPVSVVLDLKLYEQLLEAKAGYDAYMRQHLQEIHEEMLEELNDPEAESFTTKEEFHEANQKLWEEAMSEIGQKAK